MLACRVSDGVRGMGFELGMPRRGEELGHPEVALDALGVTSRGRDNDEDDGPGCPACCDAT